MALSCINIKNKKMDVTVVNTPLPVKVESSELKVKTTQIPFNLILNRTSGVPPPIQPIMIKEENTDYDLIISYVYVSGVAAIPVGAATVAGFGLTITDNSLSTPNKSTTIVLATNVNQHFGTMTSIVIRKNQKCSFHLVADNPSTRLSADFFVSGTIARL
jgi:hypothetical protein